MQNGKSFAEQLQAASQNLKETPAKLKLVSTNEMSQDPSTAKQADIPTITDPKRERKEAEPGDTSFKAKVGEKVMSLKEKRGPDRNQGSPGDRKVDDAEFEIPLAENMAYRGKPTKEQADYLFNHAKKKLEAEMEDAKKQRSTERYKAIGVTFGGVLGGLLAAALIVVGARSATSGRD